MLVNILQRRGAGYWAAILGVAVVTAIFAPFHATLSTTTVALAYLLVVLFVATGWGSRPAHGGVGARRAVLQLLLPAARLHLHDRGSAELGRARRLSRHRRHGRPALGAGQAARGRGRGRRGRRAPTTEA